MSIRRWHVGITGAAAALAAAALVSCTSSQEELAAGHAQLVSRYCTDCHNSVDFEADLNLEDADKLYGKADYKAARTLAEQG